MKSLRLFLSTLLFGLLIAGCSGLKTRNDKSENQDSLSGAIKSDSRPSSEKEDKGEKAKEPSLPPALPLSRGRDVPKVALVLGPGGVKSFAHTGVLKALIQEKIPISAVVGIEWGALIGGLFAQNGLVHELEWKIYKLQKEDLPGKGGFFSSRFKSEPISILGEYFQKNLKGFAVEKSQVHFACPSISLWTGSLVWENSGDLMKVMEKCLPYPPLFKPSGSWMAAAFSIEDSIKMLKKKYSVVIYVNILGSGELLEKNEMMEEYPSALLWQEIRRSQREARQFATDVIDVDTKQFKMYDFENRRDLVNLGELAGLRGAKRIAKKYGY